MNNNVARMVIDILESIGTTYFVYLHVKPNPTVKNVQDGLNIAQIGNVDGIIAVGGGSVIDTAKAISIIMTNPEHSNVISLSGAVETREKGLPLFALPTTAGTAAEVTINYVITDETEMKKMVCVDVHDIPVCAIIDPDLMQGMPQQLAATTGMDALTHAVEAYIGGSTTAETRREARAAVRLIFRYIEQAWRNGEDRTARKQMLLASFMAGDAFSKSYVGYVHAVAHSLGGMYNTPHGLANAVLLPHVLEAYGESVYQKLYELSIAAGIAAEGDDPERAAKKFIRAVRRLNRTMGIPETLPEIRKKDIPAMTGRILLYIVTAVYSVSSYVFYYITYMH